jgi:recombination protein RecR
MLDDIPSLNQLLKILQQIPYLASKNVYKVADHFLHMDPAKIQQFCSVLMQANEAVVPCENCFCLKEQDRVCLFCVSKKRDHSLICIVETWQEVFAIEKTNGYLGVYHVLGGVICPLDGIGPEDLTIQQLLMRIDNGIKEVILATNQTPEGEATAAYIAVQLRKKQVEVSCLARGLPVGSLLGTMDRLTVYKALSERRRF